MRFEADLDLDGRYASETVVASSDEVRVLEGGGRTRVTLPRGRVTGFEVESYVSSGALYARVDGAPCELVRFTNGRIPAAAAFGRALRDEAPPLPEALRQPEQDQEPDDTGHAFTRWSVFRRAMRFAPRAPVKLVLVIAALLLHTGANVAAPYLAGTVFFDRVLTPTDTLYGQVGLLVAMIALVRVAELSFRIVWAWIWGLYHHRIGLGLRSAVFARVQRLSLGFFSNNLTGSLLTRMNRDMNGVGSLLRRQRAERLPAGGDDRGQPDRDGGAGPAFGRIGGRLPAAVRVDRAPGRARPGPGGEPRLPRRVGRRSGGGRLIHGRPRGARVRRGAAGAGTVPAHQ